MIRRTDDDLAALMQDDELFERAVAEAQAEAVRRHRLLGEPVAVWRDGRVIVETAPPAADPEQREAGGDA